MKFYNWYTFSNPAELCKYLNDDKNRSDWAQRPRWQLASVTREPPSPEGRPGMILAILYYENNKD